MQNYIYNSKYYSFCNFFFFFYKKRACFLFFLTLKGTFHLKPIEKSNIHVRASKAFRFLSHAKQYLKLYISYKKLISNVILVKFYLIKIVKVHPL